MSKHTPGPWRAYCRDVSYTEGQPWPEDQFLQWEVDGPEQPPGRGEFFEADARLIAAAPDLLEALQHMVALLKAIGYGTEHADCAIAKATGPVGTQEAPK